MVRKTEAWIHTAGANVALQSWLMDIFEYDHRVHWPMSSRSKWPMRRVSGLCQPTYVLDVPGGFGKVPIGPLYVGARDSCGARDVLDYQGNAHRYAE